MTEFSVVVRVVVTARFFCVVVVFFFVQNMKMQAWKWRKKSWHHSRRGYKPFYWDFLFSVVFVCEGKLCRLGGIYMWWAGLRVMSTGSLMTYHDPAPRKTRDGNFLISFSAEMFVAC